MRCGIAFWSKTVTDLEVKGETWFTAIYDALVLDGFLYLAGGFTEILGQPRNHIAKVRIEDWTLDPWDPAITGGSFGGCVNCLETDGSHIYVGGRFDYVGGVVHECIAKISVDGVVSSWDPSLHCHWNDVVTDCIIDGSTLWICGGISQVGGTTQEGIAGIDTITGALHPVRPQVRCATYAYPYKIHITGGYLICGGQFYNVKESGGTTWKTRENLCAFSLSDGSLHAADPAPNDAVHAFHGDMSNLIISGYFTQVYGTGRPYLASIDMGSGSVDLAYPQADGAMTATATDGVYDYVSGQQTTIGGESRLGIARIDHWGRVVDAWAPPFLCQPESRLILPVLDIDPPMIVFGGGCDAAGIPPRLCFLDPITGMPM